MATAYPLEDEISCSVCFEVYRDPHVLMGCLHTFCLTCTQQLQHKGHINCPECREVTSITEVRKDFKTQRIIDALTKSKLETKPVKIGSSICGMCNNVKNAIKIYCEECKHYMCDGCNMAHKRMIVCKSHTVKPITAMAKAAENKILNSVKKLEEQKRNVEKKLQECDGNTSEINQVNNQQLQALRQYTEAAIKSLKESENSFKKMINYANSSIIQNLTEWKGICISNCDEMKAKIDSLNDVISSNNLNTLLDVAQYTDEVTDEDIKNSQTSLNNIKPSLISQVSVQKCDKWDVKDHIEVKLGDTIVKIPTICHNAGPTKGLLFTQIHKKKYTLSHSCQLDFHPMKLCKIQKKIWAVGLDKIVVSNQNGQLEKVPNYFQLESIHGIILTHNNQIIVSCEDGLHQLELNGQYKTKLLGGNFSDVFSADGMLYALEHQLCEMMVLSYSSKWKILKQTKLHYNNAAVYDKIYMLNKCIYISSWNNKCIYVYDLQLQLLRVIKCHEYSSVCDVDAEGNLIISLYESNEVLLYTRQGSWQEIPLPMLTGNPMHVLIEDNGSIWVALIVDKKLHKYSSN